MPISIRLNCTPRKKPPILAAYRDRLVITVMITGACTAKAFIAYGPLKAVSTRLFFLSGESQIRKFQGWELHAEGASLADSIQRSMFFLGTGSSLYFLTLYLFLASSRNSRIFHLPKSVTFYGALYMKYKDAPMRMMPST